MADPVIATAKTRGNPVLGRVWATGPGVLLPTIGKGDGFKTKGEGEGELKETTLVELVGILLL